MLGSMPQLSAICSTLQFIVPIQNIDSHKHPANRYPMQMSHAAKTPKDVLEYAKKHEAKQVDLRFTDLPGLQHHVSYPITQLKEDPFYETRTLVMTCDVIDPITRQHYDRDPRWIAQKAEMYLKNSGLADTAYFGAEAEFFIFDNVRFDQNAHS